MGLHIARILSFELMYSSDEEYYRSQIQWEYLYMLITCAVTPFVIALQYYTFLSVGCNIVNQMREDIYRKVIRLPLEWFENKENHAELISVRLGADIYTINHIISKYLPHLCGALSSVLLALFLAFFF
jgi:ABC-type multidrug transport system fused ATPase/permease subunit